MIEQEHSVSAVASAWVGRAVLDPSGLRIGHVERVTDDPLGGARLRIRCEWGVLDWLFAMGGGKAPTFEVHSEDVLEDMGDLRLRG